MPLLHLKTLHELDATEGTVQLRKGASSTSTSTGELILIPHPSTHDPNDPLRWPRWKKHVAFTSICAFTFLANYGIGGLASAFYLLSIEFDVTPAETSHLLSWPILVLVVFNFFWVPMANYFGKRPIFCFASLLLCLCYVWGAMAMTFRSLLWSNIIAAFAGSSTEALGAAMVNDLYFLHERSGKMGIYMNAISGGNTIGPLICGFVITGASWRWHKWIAVILTGVNFVAVVLFVPETRYDRCSTALASTESRPATASASADELAVTDRKSASATAHLVSYTQSHPSEFPKKEWRQGLSLWSGTAKDTNLLKMFIRPFPLIIYPAVLFAFLGYAVTLAWVVAINILNPFVLQAPPYNWKPSVNGLINIPGFLGNLVGSFTSGWLVDRYSDWRTRKNGGVFQPESRLFLLIVPAVVAPAGCVLFGYGVERTLHWTTLFFGYGMVAVGLTAVRESDSDFFLRIDFTAELQHRYPLSA